jgi:hypothetical protein
MAIPVSGDLDECGKTATEAGLLAVAEQPQFDGLLTAPTTVSYSQTAEYEVLSCDRTKESPLAAPLLSCLQPSQRP